MRCCTDNKSLGRTKNLRPINGRKYCLMAKRSEINPNHTTAVFSLAYRCTPPIIGSGNLPLVKRTIECPNQDF